MGLVSTNKSAEQFCADGRDQALLRIWDWTWCRLQGLRDSFDLTLASLLFRTNCLALTAICNRCQHTPPLATRHCSTVARCPGLSGKSPSMPLCCCCCCCCCCSCMLSSACAPSVIRPLAALCSPSCASSPGAPCLPMSGPARAAVSSAVSAGSAELLKAVTAVAIAPGSVGCLGLWSCCDRDPDASSCDPTNTRADILSQMSVVIAAWKECCDVIFRACQRFGMQISQSLLLPAHIAWPSVKRNLRWILECMLKQGTSMQRDFYSFKMVLCAPD